MPGLVETGPVVMDKKSKKVYRQADGQIDVEQNVIIKALLNCQLR